MKVLERMDAAVHEHVMQTAFYTSEVTLERAKMLVRQHRLNTRIRNSVMKLAVATNCPDWDLRLKIIGASAQEIIADDEFGDGKPHWRIIEELGEALGMSLDEIRSAQPLPTTRLAWLAWETLTRNRHWLEGLVANTCAERVNCPGYGTGRMRELGWSGAQRERWEKAFGLSDDQMAFWKIHSAADLEHSNLGWNAVARWADELGMADAVVEACKLNLYVWTTYWTGINDAADAIAKNGHAAAT